MSVVVERRKRPAVIIIALGTRPAALFLPETFRRITIPATRAMITIIAVIITLVVMKPPSAPVLSGITTY